MISFKFLINLLNDLFLFCFFCFIFEFGCLFVFFWVDVSFEFVENFVGFVFIFGFLVKCFVYFLFLFIDLDI